MNKKNNKRIFISGIFILSIIVPIIILFVWSFINNYTWPDLIPKNFGTRGWQYLFQNRLRVIESLKNSVIISFGTTLLTILLSVPCANALAFYDFKGKKIVETLILAPLVIPTVSISMGLGIQFIRLGLARTYFGIILVCIVSCIPYAVRSLKEVFLIVGNSYKEQAKMLGASESYVFRKITLPLILPGIIFSAIMCYIISFSQYFLVLLIGGGKIITFTMEMFPYISSADRMLGSVYAIIFILNIFILLVIMEYIIKRFYKEEMNFYV